MLVSERLSIVFFFFKQKTAYEMRISDWSSDGCSSDLFGEQDQVLARLQPLPQAVAMPVGLVRPPIDEDAPLQLGEKSEQRPGPDLGLGDEAARHERAQDHDVEIGGMVADEEGRARRRDDRKSTRLNSSH